MRKVCAVLSTLLFFVWLAVRVSSYIDFDRGCEGYLKRAADSNTVELAMKNLEVAVQYAEDKGLTSGYTSVLWRTPDADIGFWYENLNASLKELQSIKPDATQLERTNVLMKLRETILDQGQSTNVTAPQGISIYPLNALWAWWGFISFIMACCFWFLVTTDYYF